MTCWLYQMIERRKSSRETGNIVCKLFYTLSRLIYFEVLFVHCILVSFLYYLENYLSIN